MKKKISKKKNIIKKINNPIENLIPLDFKLKSMKEDIDNEIGNIQYFILKNNNLLKID
jgi:hypothetical protein